MYLEERVEKLETENAALKARLESLEAQRTDKFVTPAQLAEIMQCSTNTVYIRIRAGDIVADRRTGNPRIPMSQFYGKSQEKLVELGSRRRRKKELTMEQQVFG